MGCHLKQHLYIHESNIVQQTLCVSYAITLNLLATTATTNYVLPITAFIHTDLIYFVLRYSILDDICGADYVAQSAAAHATFYTALHSTNRCPIAVETIGSGCICHDCLQHLSHDGQSRNGQCYTFNVSPMTRSEAHSWILYTWLRHMCFNSMYNMICLESCRFIIIQPV